MLANAAYRRTCLTASALPTHEELNARREGATPLEAHFASACAPTVSSNYVANLEAFLRRLHLTCMVCFYYSGARGASERMRWEGTTDVVRIDMEASGRAVRVHRLEARPCAEGYGIERLVLFELARTCAHFGSRLEIGRAVERARALAERAWGDCALFTFDSRPEDAMNALRVAAVTRGEGAACTPDDDALFLL